MKLSGVLPDSFCFSVSRKDGPVFQERRATLLRPFLPEIGCLFLNLPDGTGEGGGSGRGRGGKWDRDRPVPEVGVISNKKITQKNMENNRRKPDWLKIKLPMGQLSVEVMRTVRGHHLNTICTSGRCPNQGECWGCGTATFMIAGNVCTRACKFCNVATGRPSPLDPREPERVAASVRLLKLKHVVITSVDRDDVEDLGAAHWVEVIQAVKRLNPETTMEVLIPDFQGRPELVQRILDVQPEVVSHNLETVRRLSDQVRSRATYEVSLQVIGQVAASGTVAKSGIMLGLGETREEILRTMDDLRAVGCRVMTIGQYLQPTARNIEVKAYIRPEVFEEYKRIGLEKGFDFVESGPLVRSSYHAERHVIKK